MILAAIGGLHRPRTESSLYPKRGVRVHCKARASRTSPLTASTTTALDVQCPPRYAGRMQFGFDHVHLVGSDLDASERFYREMFGAETVGRRDAGGAMNLMMRLDRINLFIRSPRPPKTYRPTEVKCATPTITSAWWSRT
jgi:hypothetical protein